MSGLHVASLDTLNWGPSVLRGSGLLSGAGAADKVREAFFWLGKAGGGGAEGGRGGGWGAEFHIIAHIHRYVKKSNTYINKARERERCVYIYIYIHIVCVCAHVCIWLFLEIGGGPFCILVIRAIKTS